MSNISMTILLEATDEHYAWMLGESAAPKNAPLLLSEGIADRIILQLLRDLALDVGQQWTPSSWLIVENNELVGLISYKTVPAADGSIEIGYGIAPTHEGRGIATRAVAELILRAKHSGLRVIRAETTIDNIASQRVLERNNFIRAGERNDPEDGALIVWRYNLSNG
jgi:RimJ/RimL family protein N-acetyltransferase